MYSCDSTSYALPLFSFASYPAALKYKGGFSIVTLLQTYGVESRSAHHPLMMV